MFSSGKDVEGVIGFLIAILLVSAIILAVFYFWQPVLLQNFWNWLNGLNYTGVIAFLRMASIYLLVPVILDLLIILMVSPFIRRHY